MTIEVKNKEFESFEEVLTYCNNNSISLQDVKVKDYQINRATGIKMDLNFGSQEDFNNWTTDIMENMNGYVFQSHWESYGDEARQSYFYTDLIRNIKEKLCDIENIKKEQVRVILDSIVIDEEIYYLYTKEKEIFDLDEQELEELKDLLND